MPTMDTLTDESYMRLALNMAEATLGQTGSNPVVGCVVVKNGRIVGMGAHLREGEAHAEVQALNMAGIEAEGSTVYVTLEPCSHFGRTPPCAKRLIESRIRRVVIACLDPNPHVAGMGANQLKEHGVAVDVGMLEHDAKKLNEKFMKYIATGLPFVTLKSAVTLDGKIASREGDSRWISNEQSRQAVHYMRHTHQAIMVGSETAIRDNPKLTTRLDSVQGLNPVRIVVDSQLRLPPTLNVLSDGEAETIVLTTDEGAERAKSIYSRKQGSQGASSRTEVHWIGCGPGPHVDLQLAMKRLAERRIGSILLEGGGRLNGAMLEAGLVDKCTLFFAPRIIGGGSRAPGVFEFEGMARMNDAITLQHIEIQKYGDNVCIIGYP